ncbi:MAG: SDR family oxidoreductase [Capsulimonadales bacterium]|nr:SDR family oxidoreductase [Capsulimonadales bacterium]
MNMESTEKLRGKGVLLVGASGGIGAATALEMAGAGARLALAGRDRTKLETLAAQIEFATGNEPVLLTGDLRVPEEAAALVENAESAFDGALDIVINAAGIGAIRPIENLTVDDFRQVLDSNLLGAMLLSQAAVKRMAPRKSGHLLHVVGILGKAPMANATAYCASKYGLTGFLQALRAEVSRRYNLKITALYLGGVDTPFYDRPSVEMRVQRDKMLTPEDAAHAIVFALTQSSHLVLGDLTLQPESHQL